MGLEADIYRIVEQAVRKALADHVCSCQPTTERRGPGARQHPDSALPRTAFTPREVAESLGVSYERVLSLIHDGRLRAVRAGQHYRIPVGAVDEYLASADRPD